MQTQSPPVERPDREKVETHGLAQLRQAVWEASQFRSFEEIRAYVDAVIAEIESDEP